MGLSRSQILHASRNSILLLGTRLYPDGVIPGVPARMPIEGYLDLVTQVGRDQAFNHLRWMLRTMEHSVPEEMSDAKLNRWLGFIQGLATGFALVSINDMRLATLAAKNAA